MRVRERPVGNSIYSRSMAVALEVCDKLAKVMDYQCGHGSMIDILRKHQNILKISAGNSEFWAKIMTMVEKHDLPSARLWCHSGTKLTKQS